MEEINYDKILKLANKLFSGSKGLCLIRIKGEPIGKSVKLDFIVDVLYNFKDFKEQTKKAAKFIQDSYQVKVTPNMVFDELCNYWEENV